MCLASALQGTAWSCSQLNRGHSGRLSALFSFVLDIRKCPPFRRSHYLILERHIQVWLVRPLALHLVSKGWCLWWCTGGALSSSSRFVCHRSVSLACVCWVSNIQGKKKKADSQWDSRKDTADTAPLVRCWTQLTEFSLWCSWLIQHLTISSAMGTVHGKQQPLTSMICLRICILLFLTDP